MTALPVGTPTATWSESRARVTMSRKELRGSEMTRRSPTSSTRIASTSCCGPSSDTVDSASCEAAIMMLPEVTEHSSRMGWGVEKRSSRMVCSFQARP